MQNTENFNLKVYEGEDLFNPLTVENVNIQAIDAQMKKNENHAVGDATELVSGTVHAITRLTPDAPMLRFLLLQYQVNSYQMELILSVQKY